MGLFTLNGGRKNGRVAYRPSNVLFEDDLGGEKMAKEIQIADDLLSRFERNLLAFEFDQAESLIPDIVESGGGKVDALCLKIQKAHDNFVKEAREKIAEDIASLLPKLESFSGRLDGQGGRKAVLEWLTAVNSKADAYCLVRKQETKPINVTDGTIIYRGASQSFIDTTIPIGVPCYYAVFSSYDGRINPTPNILNAPIVYAPPIESFEVRMGGYSCCAIAKLLWKLPTYDVGARIALLLEKISGNERVKIDLTEGQEQYLDTEITVEEPYRYELTLIVSGISLSPIVREGHVPRLPELPTVPASCYYQEGRYWLRIEWPDDIFEIRLTESGGRSVQYTKEDYDRRHVAIPHTFSESQLEVQAIRRFGDDKLACGPKSQVVFSDARSILYVSIERAHRGPLSFLKPWQKDIWGIRFDFDGNSFPQEVRVSIEDGGATQTFTIEGDRIRKGEFMPFPLRWGVRSGVNIDVQPSDCSYVKFLTSQMIP